MKAELEHNTIIQENFEQQYLSLRKKEGRVYTDEQVKQLPDIAEGHPLSGEWRMRKFSAEKLADYLDQKKRPLKILDVGCGNGWLSHQLSMLKDVSVTGIDVNSIELEQARRVFTRDNLEFVHGDLRSGITDGEFDVIIFAASIQYFESLGDIIQTALGKLKGEGRRDMLMHVRERERERERRDVLMHVRERERRDVLMHVQKGEIHILDTHFYKSGELGAAVQRSKQYFTEIGFPMMERFYFHHSLEALNEFSFDTLYDPGSFKNRILKRSPFRWIRIKKC